jgi:ribosomal protein S13
VSLLGIESLLYIKQSKCGKSQRKSKIRFEHILRIYWSKGFFYGGKLFYTDKTLDEVFANTPGIGYYTQKKLLLRLELPANIASYSTPVKSISSSSNITLINPLNIIFSQINSVNNQLPELKKLNTLRLYLIKSYRGRCHAIGKPVNGQRTWSNAWNSYNYNRSVRSFIGETKKLLKKDSKSEKINYKLTQKKYATKSKKQKQMLVVKKTWF